MFDLSQFKIEFGGSNGSFFKRNFYVQLNDPEIQSKVENFLKKYDKDSYRCVYAYENDDIENCRIYGDLYFDLDGNIHNKKGYEELRSDVTMLISYLKSIGLEEDQIELYFSGSKGFHVTVPASVLAIEPSTNLNQLYKAWAVYLYNTFKIYTIDLVIYDRKRLLRIPDTVNSKTGLKKTRIPHRILWDASAYDEFILLIENNQFKIKRNKNINREAAIFFYKKSQNFYKKHDNTHGQESKSFSIPETKVELLPCVQYGLENGAVKGCRNNTLVALSSAIMQSGYRLEETLDIMHSWNENNEEPLAFNEIEFTVRSAYSMLLSGKRYGCSALKEMNLCIGSDCKVAQKESRDVK